jgi:hypothetical protein
LKSGKSSVLPVSLTVPLEGFSIAALVAAPAVALNAAVDITPNDAATRHPCAIRFIRDVRIDGLPPCWFC